MPVAAVTYDIKPGHEEEIAEVFGSFRRVGGSPVIRDAGEAEAGRIRSTAVFIRDAVLVRFIEYDGDLDAVLRFMAVQPGVQELERRLAPFLASPRQTATPEGFVETFHRSELRCLSQLATGS
jgi:hypothetical protein